MSVLPYCVILADQRVKKPPFGVGGKEVEALKFEALRIFYSHIDDSMLAPESLRTSALEFHRVLASIFRRTAVVPFRFPNLLQSYEQLESHLRANMMKYKSFLEKNGDAVQMEVLLSNSAGENVGQKSGVEYLRERQQQFRNAAKLSDAVREKINNLVLDSKTKESRLFFLVKRAQSEELRERLKHLPEIRVSGPWPATEFLEDSPAK